VSEYTRLYIQCLQRPAFEGGVPVGLRPFVQRPIGAQPQQPGEEGPRGGDRRAIGRSRRAIDLKRIARHDVAGWMLSLAMRLAVDAYSFRSKVDSAWRAVVQPNLNSRRRHRQHPCDLTISDNRDTAGQRRHFRDRDKPRPAVFHRVFEITRGHPENSLASVPLSIATTNQRRMCCRCGASTTGCLHRSAPVVFNRIHRAFCSDQIPVWKQKARPVRAIRSVTCSSSRAAQ
jgi:hypothetical protein